MTRKSPRKTWMQQHVSDPYVHKARAEGYRSRAAFKLLEIGRRDRLLRPGLVVVELGAAPGGWSQVLAAAVQPAGRVIALDLLEMEPIPGVTFVQGDFRDEAVLARLEQTLAGVRVDLVVSDMAPNLSGVGAADQARSMHLAELALEFALKQLKPEGVLLIKAFQGSGFPELQALIRRNFAEVFTRKPRASRDRSAEVYLLGRRPRRERPLTS